MTLSREAFEARLRAIGAERYHDRHPFHQRLHSGGCGEDELRAWVLNRYCYQAAIPRKDAALIARCADPALRRAWRRRLEDHDGPTNDDGWSTNDATGGASAVGGLARWLRLAEAVGLDQRYVASEVGALPAVRFAVEAYVRFVAERSLLEAVASSLTELFAPKIHRERIAGLLAHYAFATDETLAYFSHRLTEAPRDVAFGLDYVLTCADTAERQEAAVNALIFKTEVLWAQLDAIQAAYAPGGAIPPGAWRPGQGLIGEATR
ncbi:MAG: pyrroloquinoline-quinone synthase PqqC [Pseudomonadota bacterium]